MKPLNIQELRWLIGPHGTPCVSIYLPTHRHAPAAKQDPIRYRGLVGRAREIMSSDRSRHEVDEVVESLLSLDTKEFWNEQREGLAVFRSPDVQMFYRVPLEMPELVVVAPTFHTKPLLRYLSTNQHFRVLVLSTQEIALYEGTSDALEPVDLGSMPTSLAAVLGAQHRARIDFRGVSKGWRPVYRAAGPGQEDRKDALGEYFRRIDRALTEVLDDDRAPLVLAGVGYFQGLYRAASRNPHLLDEGVEGNFDKARPEELHAKVWPVVAKHRTERERVAVEAYRASAAAMRGSDQLEAIARAAVQGRVRTLFLATGKPIWGHIDDAGSIATHEAQRGSDDVDVLDELGEMTLVRGGDVLVLDPEHMPTERPCAAIFRY